MSIFLSISSQHQFFVYFHAVFAIAMALHVIALLFLVKETPPNQATIRNHLIIIQVMLIIIDINLDVLFCPVFMFPALAGYAIGLLMKMGISAHTGFSITLVFYVWLGVSIICCVTFRHQSIIPDDSFFKFKKKYIYGFQLIGLLASSLFYIFYAFNGNDSATIKQYLLEDSNNITWIRDRGSYYVTQRTTTLTNGIFIGIAIMFSTTVECFLRFGHMYYVLQKDRAKRSPQSIKAIRRSLLNLFCQLVIPLLLFYVPADIILLGIAIENFTSFEVSFRLFFLLPWHSIGHNLILLLITTPYRKRIVSILKGRPSVLTRVVPSR